jgi:hypothetical protein
MSAVKGAVAPVVTKQSFDCGVHFQVSMVGGYRSASELIYMISPNTENHGETYNESIATMYQLLGE